MKDGVRIADSIGAIDRDEWSRIVRGAAAPAFYDYDFLRAYERSPLAPTSAFYYLLFPGSAAVLPAYLQNTQDAAGDVSGLGLPDRDRNDRILLSHVTHCYDTVLPAVGPLPVASACEALADLAAQHGVKWFAFLDVEDGSLLARQLAAYGLQRIPMETRYRVDLTPYADVEDVIAANPSRKARRNLRNTHSRALRSGLEIAVHRPPLASADIAGAVKLCRDTTARHGTPGYYPPEFHEFVCDAGECVRVVEAQVGGRLATAAVCLVDDRRFHLWAGGADYSFADQGIGLFPLMLRSALGLALDARRPWVEAGRGNGDVKKRFGLNPAPLAGFVGRP